MRHFIYRLDQLKLYLCADRRVFPFASIEGGVTPGEKEFALDTNEIFAAEERAMSGGGVRA
jgi:hypothetical protein